MQVCVCVDVYVCLCVDVLRTVPMTPYLDFRLRRIRAPAGGHERIRMRCGSSAMEREIRFRW